MTEPYVVRDLAVEDYDKCRSLVTDPLYERMFASTEIDVLHILGTYAAVAVSPTDGEVCAFLLAGPTPQYFSDVDDSQQPTTSPDVLIPTRWIDYISLYHGIEISEFTSAWVRLLGCAPEHTGALSALIQAYFSYDPHNEVLLLLTHPFTSPPQYIRRVFPELASETPIPSNYCKTLCCPRVDVLPPLLVRRAEMRDHDDLVSIFESQNTSLQERFGQFFIADLITSAEEDRSMKLSVAALDYESYSIEYRNNESNAIRRPVSFMYVEKFSPLSSEDAATLENLRVTHCLDKFALSSIPPECIGFIRATATLPIAESRCGEILASVFDMWPDIECLFLSLPSSVTCTDMQLLRFFTLVDPRSPLSPRESLFVCHRDAWLGALTVIKARTEDQLEDARRYLATHLNAEGASIRVPYEIESVLEALSQTASFGTLVAYNLVGERRVPIAVCVVDMNVGHAREEDLYGQYMADYAGVLRGDADSVDVPYELTQTDSIWTPSICLGGQGWCKMHYDADLSRYAYLKAFVVDPLFLQFREAILSSCMHTAGVDGFLLACGFDMQRAVQRLYDPVQGFLPASCDLGSRLTSFERELLRSTHYIPRCTFLPTETDHSVVRTSTKRHYDGRIPTGQADKSARRLEDEAALNRRAQQNYSDDVRMSALRMLAPQFSLFALRPTNLITRFKAPVTVANSCEPEEHIVKPAVTYTDRLVVLGSGLGLLSALITLHDCAPLARFKTVVVICPPPGPITPHSFEFADDEYPQYIDHGESMAPYRDRCIQLLYDIYVGDLLEVSLADGVIRLASGAEVGFDLVLLCPEGADSEALRLVPTFNLNSAVSFSYGVVDPSAGQSSGALVQTQTNTLNTRGYRDEDIMKVMSDPRSYSRMLSCMISEGAMDRAQGAGGGGDREGQEYQGILAARLNGRLLMRLLTQGDPLMKRQMAAVYCSTLVSNLSACVGALYSPSLLKALAAKRAKEAGRNREGTPTRERVDDAQSDAGSTVSGLTKQGLALSSAGGQGSGEEEAKPTAQVGPYRMLSPCAKACQIVSVGSTAALAELPLVARRLAGVVAEARAQLFPSLSSTRPPRGRQNLAAPTATVSVVDAARTSVAVVGDTFEALSVVAALLDAGIHPSSIFLLVPASPAQGVDQAEAAGDGLVDYLVSAPGYGGFAPRAGAAAPGAPGASAERAHGQRAGAGAGRRGEGFDSQKALGDKTTSQSAGRRVEAYPRALHQMLQDHVAKLGVGVLRNVRIADTLVSLAGGGAKGLGKTPGWGKPGDDDDAGSSEEDETDGSDEGEDEDAAGLQGGLGEDAGDDADADADADADIDVRRLTALAQDVREALGELDDMDVVLRSRVPGFAEELEQLDDVCDALLLGDCDSVLTTYFAEGDADVDLTLMEPGERRAELFRILRRRVARLASLRRQALSRKRRYRRKMAIGSSLCGLRLALQAQSAMGLDADGAAGYGDDLPPSIILSTGSMTRIFTGSGDTMTRMQINSSEPSPPLGSLDIHCCAVFLTECFGVPFNYSSALMKSDLIFDRALIVNSNAQTSDLRVYAACNLGKISRATLLQRLQRSHEADAPDRVLPMNLPLAPHTLTADLTKPVVDWNLFSPVETARYAAYKMVTRRLTNMEAAEDTGIVPEFTESLVLNCRVPGGYVFRSARPLRDIRDPLLSAEKHFRVVETGSLANIRECRRWVHMEVDPFGVVDSVTAYSTKPLLPDVRMLLHRTVGLPVALLNSLEGRWAKGEVTDIIDFLCKPQLQLLLSDDVRRIVSDLTSDILSAQNFQDIVQRFSSDAYVDSNGRSVSDIVPEALAPGLGRDILKQSANGKKAMEILISICKQLADEARERFPEITRDVETRGTVTFADHNETV